MMYGLTITLATLATTGGFLLVLSTLLLPGDDELMQLLLAIACFAFAGVLGIWVVAEQIKGYLDGLKNPQNPDPR